MAHRSEGHALPSRAGQRLRRSLAPAFVVLSTAACVLAPAEQARADNSFVPGDASAIAQTVQVAPRTGGLSAAITVGRTIADYRSSLAQASSQTLDLGVIGSTLTVQCDASPPAARPDQLPQPLLAESDKGNSHATKTTAGQGSSGLAATAGQETVTATTQPQSAASFDGNNINVPGVLSVAGLHSDSHAQLIKNTARVATANADVGTIKLAGGAIVLSGMHWTASQRTGKGAAGTSKFTMGSATLAGKHLPVNASNLKSTTTKLNKALAATGLHLTLPKRTTSKAKVSVTPLTVGIDDSPIGNSVLNPLLGAVQPVTNATLNALIGVNCKLGSLLGAADLIVSGVDGTGGLDLNLGGATAMSDGKTYGDPFGGGSGPTLGSHQHHGGGGGSTSTHSSSATSSGTGTASGSTGGNSVGTTTTSQGGNTGGTANTSESTAISQSCATTSPANRPGCSRGAGLKVGLIALGLLIAVAATDAVVLQNRRRRAEAE